MLQLSQFESHPVTMLLSSFSFPLKFDGLFCILLQLGHVVFLLYLNI